MNWLKKTFFLGIINYNKKKENNNIINIILFYIFIILNSIFIMLLLIDFISFKFTFMDLRIIIEIIFLMYLINIYLLKRIKDDNI